MKNDFDAIISKYADIHGVPFQWIKAVIATESSFYPKAYRAEPQINDGSYGLMQLLGRTARNLGFTGDASQLFEPDLNIQYGTKLLAQLQRSYGDDFRRIYSAYNSGKPDLYLTSTQVGSNVDRAMRYLESIIAEVGEIVKKKSIHPKA